MPETKREPELLCTSAGDFPLEECRLQIGARELTVLHVAAMVSHADEAEFLLDAPVALPYGIALWSSTIALAYEIAARAAEFRSKTVLELGAGTGLPGIAAACADAARVVQTDKNNVALRLCKRNCELNKIETIEHRNQDWSEWTDNTRYDLIVGSDILYATEMHEHLRRIFETNLLPNARILLSDPFRSSSLRLLERMQTDGWTVALNKWNIGAESSPRPIAVFELTPPK